MLSVNSDGSTDTAVGSSSPLCSDGILCALGMFDNDESTMWHCNQDSPCIFELDFGVKRTVRRIYAKTNQNGNSLEIGVKQEPGNDWSVVKSFTISGTSTVSVADMQFMRVVVTNWEGQRPAIGEFKLMFESTLIGT